MGMGAKRLANINHPLINSLERTASLWLSSEKGDIGRSLGRFLQ